MEKIGQGRLVAQQDAELEEYGVAAADLGQAHELGLADSDLVRGEGTVARGQQNFGKWVGARFERGDIFSGFICVNAARAGDACGVQSRDEEVAQPAVGLGHVLRDALPGQADGAAQHVLIQEECAPAGAPLEDLDAGGAAALDVDDRRKAVAEAKAKHHGG